MSDPIVCPNCGTANAAGSLYCDQCSRPLAGGGGTRPGVGAPGPAAVSAPPTGASQAPAASAPVSAPPLAAPPSTAPHASAPPPLAAAAPHASAPPPPAAAGPAAAAPPRSVPAPARAGGRIALIVGAGVALLIFLVGSLGLFASGALTPPPTPNVQATVVAIVGNQATAQATPANTPAGPTGGPATPALPPTAVAAPPSATALPGAGMAGTVRFQDHQQASDRVVVSLTGLATRPVGRALFAWLSDSASGTSLRLGRLVPGADGQATLIYDDPQAANLLSTYDGALITLEDPESTPRAPSGAGILAGQLPPLALIHIRHLLVSFPETPNKTGLEVGLRDQVKELIAHAVLLSQSQAAGSLAGVKLHAEHLVNLIEGVHGRDYGDLNKDGKITNPGDGFGLLPNGDLPGYLLGAQDHADLAAAAADAPATLKDQAAALGITTSNVAEWASTIRDRALALIPARDLQTTAPLVREIGTLAPALLQGVAGSDGQVRPVRGSGGVRAGYAQAQLMAEIDLQVVTPAGAAGTPRPANPVPATPVATPTVPPPTPTPTPLPAGGAQVTILIRQSQFS